MNFRTTKLFAPIAKNLTYAAIIVCSVLIAVNIAVSVYFNPQTAIDRALDSLTREYYEDYLYPKLVDGIAEQDLAAEMESYQKTGVSPTYLRQLLLYDQGRRNEAEKYFTMKDHTCDINETYVVYYPDPPFSQTDYHFTTKLVCQ